MRRENDNPGKQDPTPRLVPPVPRPATQSVEHTFASQYVGNVGHPLLVGVTITPVISLGWIYGAAG